MKVKLIQETKNPVGIIADIASICYGKNNAHYPKRLVRNLRELGHESVFEHVYFTWKIEGISRSCLAQLTRHRHASFTVKSQRYVNHSDTEIVAPKTVLNSENMSIIWNYTTNELKSAYKMLIDRGIPKEDARFILPEGTSVDLYMSCNLRELLHIYDLRNDKSAQWEIRELINKMVNEINDDLNFLFRKEDVK